MTPIHSTNESITDCIITLSQRYNIIDIIDLDKFSQSSAKLQQRIYETHKTAYDNNDRIIITSTVDYYSTNVYGTLLKSAQVIINNIDISNFFVSFLTTNDEINSEYTQVLTQYSTDPIPFQIYKCFGEFTRANTTNGEVGQYNVLNATTEINDYVVDIIDNNKSFCIMPWVQTQVQTNGMVYPCCLYNKKTPLGNSKENTLSEIFNDTAARKLRVDMLQKKHIPGCEICNLNNSTKHPSFRKKVNNDYLKFIKNTVNTTDIGYYEYKHTVWDIRFDNLCNLKCRTCDEQSSTSWFKDSVSLNETTTALQILRPKGIFEQYMEHIDYVEQIYFAGGEPLIIKECWDVLRNLIQHNRTDVKLVYNTNLTKLTFKKQHIFDYWNKFDEVHVGASLDAMHERAEYWRAGTKWETIEKNRREMIKHVPDVGFSIDATISLVNALHIVDFHQNWVNNGLITVDQFNPKVLEFPTVFCLRQAPDVLKTQIYDKVSKHIEWLIPLDKTEKSVNAFKSILDALDSKTNEFDSQGFWNKIDKVDILRKEKLLDIFPELYCLNEYPR